MISEKQYDAQYAADMKQFACDEVIERELQTAIRENGFDFDGWSDRQIAEDLHRHSAVAELWPFEMILESVERVRCRVGIANWG